MAYCFELISVKYWGAKPLQTQSGNECDYNSECQIPTHQFPSLDPANRNTPSAFLYLELPRLLATHAGHFPTKSVHQRAIKRDLVTLESCPRKVSSLLHPIYGSAPVGVPLRSNLVGQVSPGPIPSSEGYKKTTWPRTAVFITLEGALVVMRHDKQRVRGQAAVILMMIELGQIPHCLCRWRGY